METAEPEEQEVDVSPGGEPGADSPPITPVVTGFRKAVYLFLAGVCFLLALLGILLPGLPTTPFLLLTSYLLLRTSPRLHQLLLRSYLFGPLLRDWQERRGIQRHIKLRAIFCVILLVGISLYFSPLSIWAKIGIAGVALMGITVVVRLPEIHPEDDPLGK